MSTPRPVADRYNTDSRASRASEEGATAARSRSRFVHTHLGSLTLGALAIASGTLAWQVLVLSGAVPAYMLPAPGDVAHIWWLLVRNGVLIHHVGVSLHEALLGFALAFVVGAGIGYPLAKSRVVSSILSPYVAATQAMPILALAPLLVVWFGLGLFSKVLICALIVFFPILVNTSVGVRTVDRTLVEAAQTEGANAWQILSRVEVPLALRTILGGIKMGLTLSMTGAIIAEFVASDSGLGYLMTLARSEYDSALLFAASLTMVGLAVLGYALVNALERALIDWD
jgi:NitT/TauT family transport system permease protein